MNILKIIPNFKNSSFRNRNKILCHFTIDSSYSQGLDEFVSSGIKIDKFVAFYNEESKLTSKWALQVVITNVTCENIDFKKSQPETGLTLHFFLSEKVLKKLLCDFLGFSTFSSCYYVELLSEEVVRVHENFILYQNDSVDDHRVYLYNDTPPTKANLFHQLKGLAFSSGVLLPLYNRYGILKNYRIFVDYGKSTDNDGNFYVMPADIAKVNLKVDHKIHNINIMNNNIIFTSQLETLKMLLIGMELFSNNLSSIPPCKKILLYGQSGSGKTFLVNYLAELLNWKVIQLTNANMKSHSCHDPLKFCIEYFSACDEGKNKTIIFLDDFDLMITNKSITTWIDEFEKFCSNHNGILIIIAATNNVNLLDNTIRNNFNKEIFFELPDTRQRLEYCRHFYYEYLNLSLPFELNDTKKVSLLQDIETFSNSCYGWSYSQLEIALRSSLVQYFEKITCNQNSQLVSNSNVPFKKEFECHLHEDPKIKDFSSILNNVKSFTHRLPYHFLPTKTKFNEICGLEKEISSVIQTTIWIYKHPDKFSQLGFEYPKGILLFGPPGTGKTMIAKAIATESDANFLNLSIVDLIHSDVGQSERTISDIFKLAKQNAPCILFIDEFQAIFGSKDFLGSHGRNMISQIAMELDGIQSRSGVILIAATNRPDLIDKSLLRPGRIERIIYIPPPKKYARRIILKNLFQNNELLKHKNDSRDLNREIDKQKRDELIEFIVEKTQMFTGSDLKNLFNKARWNAIKFSNEQPASFTLEKEFYENLLSTFTPTITKKMLEFYQNWNNSDYHGDTPDF